MAIKNTIGLFILLLFGMPGMVFADQGQLERGEAQYAGSCAVCHANDGTGTATFSGYLPTEPPDITGLAKQNGGTFPREQVRKTIDGRVQLKLHGGREMPIWGGEFLVESIRSDEFGNYVDAQKIVQDRINALLDYIETLQVK